MERLFLIFSAHDACIELFRLRNHGKTREMARHFIVGKVEKTICLFHQIADELACSSSHFSRGADGDRVRLPCHFIYRSAESNLVWGVGGNPGILDDLPMRAWVPFLQLFVCWEVGGNSSPAELVSVAEFDEFALPLVWDGSVHW